MEINVPGYAQPPEGVRERQLVKVVGESPDALPTLFVARGENRVVTPTKVTVHKATNREVQIFALHHPLISMATSFNFFLLNKSYFF